jgi:hypothetical protein
MPGIEDQIDNTIRYVKLLCFQWGLYMFNWVTDSWDSSCEWCVKSIRAIEHAHKEDVFVFLTRNTHPISVKGDWSGLRDNALVFSREKKRFIRYNRIQPPNNHRFDIVSLNIDCSGSSIDISSLFHEVGWKDQAMPSLFEMVLLTMIIDNKSYSIQDIEKWHLDVMDSDANTHRISLRSEVAQRPFTGWS